MNDLQRTTTQSAEEGEAATQHCDQCGKPATKFVSNVTSTIRNAFTAKTGVWRFEDQQDLGEHLTEAFLCDGCEKRV